MKQLKNIKLRTEMTSDPLDHRKEPLTDSLYSLFNTHSMNTTVLLHFEHKNDVTNIAELLYRAESCEVKFDNICIHGIIVL